MASTYLSRTQGTPTNSKKWTISFWMKGKLTDSNFYAIFGCDFDNGDSYFGVGSGGQARNEIGLLEYHTGATNYGQGYTGASLRDSSAWYHIVFAYDSTQSTASDRGKTYINGVQQTNTYSVDIPQNHDSKFNSSGVGIRVGNRSAGGGSAEYDGCLSHFHFIDGTTYDASAFGSTDSTTGEWKINTSPSVTYGNNGFFILKDGNSVTDQSGNGNNFTVAGGTLTNTEDCPSNVFCTWNPNFQRATNKFLVLTNGNTFLSSTPSGDCAVSGTLGVSSGKWYWEQITNNPDGSSNAAVIGGIHSAEDWNETPENIFYSNTAGLYSNGNARKDNVDLGNFTSSTLGTDIFGVGLDADNGDMYFWRNGTALNSGNAVITGLDTSKTWIPFAILHGGVRITTSTNFGNGYQGTTAVSSAGTNASGIGIFEYNVPTGYTALSTKGLNL